MTRSFGQDNPHQSPPGSLADLVAEPTGPAVAPFTVATYVKIFVLGALFLLVHQWQFKILFAEWTKPNWQHGWAVPLFSLFLVYSRRRELFSSPRKGCWWGMGIILFAILMETAGIFQGYYISHVGLVVMLFGLVLFVGGTGVIRKTWLPIWFLMFAMPIPPMLYQYVAGHLQDFATWCSTNLLGAMGVPITSASSAMVITSVSGKDYQLQVVEACSGVRSLLAFLAIGVAFAYLEDRPIWQRITLVVAVIPVALLCNLMRIMITAYANYRDHPEWGESFMHAFTGIIMLIPALLMMMGVLWVINRIYTEVDEDEQPPTQATPSPTESKA